MLSRSVESPKKQRGATLIGSPLAQTNPADLPCRPSQNYEVLGICNDKTPHFRVNRERRDPVGEANRR